MGFYSEAPISKSPKDINSYNDLASLERVMDEVETIQTRKQREKDAHTTQNVTITALRRRRDIYLKAGKKWDRVVKDLSKRK